MTPHTLRYSYTIEGGYKVDLPEAILESLVNNIPTPFVFKLVSDTGATVYAGVREFSAPPGELGLSSSIANDLQVEVGDLITIRSMQIPKGTEITLKPSTPGDLDYKSLLESWLPKNYTALSVGMKLVIPYLGSDHNFEVVHLSPPEPAVCVVDTDMDLLIEGETKPPLLSEGATRPTIVFDSPIELGESPILLSALVPADSDKLYISSTDLVFIGPEHATSESSYIGVTDSYPIPILTALLGPSFSILASGTVTIATSPPQSQPSSANNVCPTCGNMIPEQSFLLHTSFCGRNSVKCSECDRVFSGLKSLPPAHAKLHQITKNTEPELDCDKCHQFQSISPTSVAFHQATSCAARLHICQFCHLLVSQGETSPVDAVQGLTAHEAACGNRTANCPFCDKPVRLRNLQMHLKEHDARRKERKPPTMCANLNCPNILPENRSAKSIPFGLCAQCFGPLSVPGSNSDMVKLTQRVERRLVLQMMRGCGKSWCQNQYCAIGGNTKRSASEALSTARNLIARNELYFCVDEASTRKAMFVQLDNMYDRGWKGLAINTCGTESEAMQWLEKNARRIDEVSTN